MKQNHLRLWLGLIVVALLVVSLMASCTKSKSGGAPEETEDAATQQEATATLAGAGEPLDAADQAATDNAVMQTEAIGLAMTETAKAVSPDEATATTPPQTTPEPPTQEPPSPTPLSQTTATVEATPPAIEPTETAAVEPTAQPPLGETTHEVQSGERLFRIALQYGLTYQELAAYNNIVNPDLIYPGQILKIPARGAIQPSTAPSGNVHVVKAGENLFRIALQYNMLYTELAEANHLSYPYIILPGQELIIP